MYLSNWNANLQLCFHSRKLSCFCIYSVSYIASLSFNNSFIHYLNFDTCHKNHFSHQRKTFFQFTSPPRRSILVSRLGFAFLSARVCLTIPSRTSSFVDIDATLSTSHIILSVWTELLKISNFNGLALNEQISSSVKSDVKGGS